MKLIDTHGIPSAVALAIGYPYVPDKLANGVVGELNHIEYENGEILIANTIWIWTMKCYFERIL